MGGKLSAEISAARGLSRSGVSHRLRLRKRWLTPALSSICWSHCWMPAVLLSAAKDL